MKLQLLHLNYVAPRIAADQIIDLRYTPVYLGVPIRAKCNNKSESMPTSTLCKKSTLSFYHRVREAIAAGYLQLTGRMVTEFRQPLQVQSHLEMPGILVQLGHTQRT